MEWWRLVAGRGGRRAKGKVGVAEPCIGAAVHTLQQCKGRLVANRTVRTQHPSKSHGIHGGRLCRRRGPR